MKPTFPLVLFFMVVVFTPVFGEPSTFSSELKGLQERYTADLHALLQKHLQSGDALAAQAVQDELEKVTPRATPVGTWIWAGGSSLAVISADDTVFNAGTKGTWSWTEQKKGQIEIKWDNGFVDTLTLAKDGQSLSGQNNSGDSFSVQRVKSEKDIPGLRKEAE